MIFRKKQNACQSEMDIFSFDFSGEYKTALTHLQTFDFEKKLTPSLFPPQKI